MGGLPLGRVLGTEVRAHWSWVLLLAIITVLFGMGLTAGPGGDWPAALAWGTGAAVATLIFLSVTVHELAHVVVARRAGFGRDVVVIQLLGGSYVLEVRARTPGEEARLALGGPLVSIALVAVFGLTALILAAIPGDPDSAPVWLQAIAFVALSACLFNGFLAVVSLIPGYPMDGGLLLHAAAWRWSGNERSATATVGRAGRWLGLAMMIGGSAVSLVVELFVGLTVVIGGWLLVAASRASERRGLLEDMLAGLRVADAIDAEAGTLPPQLSLDVFAAEFLGPRLGSASLVGRPGEAVGLIGTRQVGRIPRGQWPNKRAESVMVPIQNVPSVSAEMALWPALELLERSGLDGVIIEPAPGSPEGEAPGLLTRRAAARLVHLRAEERAERPSRP
jgi:Zn-dependent protease